MRRRGIKDGLRKRIVELFRQGMTYQEIAAVSDVPYQTVVLHVGYARKADPTIRRQRRGGNHKRPGINVTERAIALLRKGWMPEEIAEELDSTTDSIRILLWNARERGAQLPVFSRRRVHLTEDERNRLEYVAAQYDVAPNRLAREIINRVLDEGLTALVLGGNPAKVLKEVA